VRWAAWTSVVVGALLAIAPWALGYSTTNTLATAEAVAVGVLIAAIALWAALARTAPGYLDYLVTVLGGWSIVAPYVLGYSTLEVARNTDVIAGVVVAAVALFNHFYLSSPARQKAAA
jgi:predicted anti-sigma-YlaC factor YlaD